MHLFLFKTRIREKRQLITMESRERKKCAKPRLPRSAKKLDANRMEKEMEELGVDISDQVGIPRGCGFEPHRLQCCGP